MIRTAHLLVLAIAALGACAAGKPEPKVVGNVSFEDMMSGGRLTGAYLEKAVRDAAKFPLGSEQNPVRADMPTGQRAYLARLICPDGKPPSFERTGLLEASPFGSLVDGFEVRCRGASAERRVIAIDMYHPGYREPLPAPGFTIASP